MNFQEDAKPKNFDEAAKRLMTPGDKALEEGAPFLGDDEAAGEKDEADEIEERATEEEQTRAAGAGELEGWQTAALPGDVKLPTDRQVTILRFRAAWTDTPGKGDRTAVLWNLSDADEKIALKRTRGEPIRTMAELARQTIRVVDGARVDWTRGPAQVDRFWNEIGAKCRQMITNMYAKNHMLDATEQADFFSHCVVVRSVSG